MANEAQSPASPLAAAQAIQDRRPKFTFKIPESARALPGDPRTVTFHTITLAEERMAGDRARAGGELAYELLKHALVAADGVPVTWDAGAKERFLEGCSPVVRSLLLGAFHKLHIPTEENQTDFLSSMTLDV